MSSHSVKAAFAAAAMGVWMPGLFVTGADAGGLNLSTLAAFYSVTNGAQPYAPLLQGADGSFYGTTFMGGVSNVGVIFRVTTSGSLSNLFSLRGTNGANPYAGLAQSADGNLYGTTFAGGASNLGTTFRVTTNGALATLISFSNSNGAKPCGTLAQGANGSFFGTTFAGGISNLGTVFRLTTNTPAALSVLASFTNLNGAKPFAGLLPGADGNFYGTTLNGGSNGGWGTVFRVTTNGALTTLLSFDGTNGANPYAGLVQSADGVLYGTTTYGGIGFDSGALQSGFGSIYRLTTNGSYAVLYLFSGEDDGANPAWSPLAKGRDGNFYGTTLVAGSNGFGTAFQVTTNGNLTTLVDFNLDSNGISAYGGLAPGPFGTFYGTTESAGSSGDGTVFRLDPAAPLIQGPLKSGATFSFSWTSLPGQMCQVQYRTNLTQSGWLNLGSPVLVTNSTGNFSDSPGADAKRFYRIDLVEPP